MDQPLQTSDAKRAHGSAGTATRMVGIGVALAIAAALVLAWRLFAAQRAAGELRAAAEVQSVVTVATTSPQALAEPTELILPGNVQANYEAPIYARTSGYLKRWLVDIGAQVTAGQLLAEIESPEIDQQLRQAQADLATAQANRKIAEVTAERWRHLRSTDSVSKQEADEKISAADASNAQVQAARANVQRLREIAGFERIVAPFDGIITARRTDIGQLINAGSGTGPELFRIADMQRLRLYVSVPQTYAATMRPGVTAQVRFPDRPGKSYVATLDSTSNAIDATTRTLLAQLLVDNESHELLPGAYAEVHFNLPQSADNPAYKLPANVLLFRADGLHVATLGPDNHVVLKPVTIGRDYGAEIEVIQGIKGTDKVILSPPDSLTAGMLVRLATPTAAEVAQTP
jgi:RND family efflux transporter MFP subunit